MAKNTDKDGLQRCPHCQREFKQLFRHMPSCKQRQDNEAEINSVTAGRPIGHTISARTESQNPKTRMDKPGQICDGCGGIFQRLNTHKPHCKGINPQTTNAITVNSSTMDTRRMHLNRTPAMETRKGSLVHCEEERLCKSAIKDEMNGSRTLTWQGSEEFHQINNFDTESTEQEEPKSCPLCGKNFKRLSTHLHACKKRQDCSSVPTSITEIDRLSDSSKQTQQTQSQLQRFGRREHISRTPEYVDHLPSSAKEDRAEGNRFHQIISRQQEILHKSKTAEAASLANLKYSQDPKAELDKLHKENTIGKVEKNAAKKVVTEMQSSFLRYLNARSNFKWNIFLTGSYSDETKIKKADEFDFIMCVDIKCRAICIDEPGKLGYCLVAPIREKNVIQEISSLMKDNYLDPSLVKDMAFELFTTVISDNEFRKGRRINRLHRNVGSPAFTIAYDSGGGKVYDIDLVPAIHFDGWPQISAIKDWQPKWRQEHKLEDLKKDYLAVAREHPNARHVRQGELLWRLSFTNTERMLWTSVDKKSLKPTCRKETFKHLKGILEECKLENEAKMPKLSSFHLRTFMLHQYDQRPDDKEWLMKDMRTCLHFCIDCLQDILKIKEMSNYYVRGHNVLEILNEQEIKIFLDALTKAKVKY